MQITHQFRILRNGRYLGTLFGYATDDGLRFTHSLACHGAQMFETTQAAQDDFFDSKARLPDRVHRAIFGEG